MWNSSPESPSDLERSWNACGQAFAVVASPERSAELSTVIPREDEPCRETHQHLQSMAQP